MIIRGNEWTFDTVTYDYEKLRPEYNKKLNEKIFKYFNLNSGNNLLEIGAG